MWGTKNTFKNYGKQNNTGVSCCTRLIKETKSWIVNEEQICVQTRVPRGVLPKELSKDNFNSGTAAGWGGGSVALILHRCTAVESCDMGI